MPRRDKNKGGEEGSTTEWALSYGDLMTLLMTFFVLIVSFSTTELIKFRQAMGSLKGSMGVLQEEEGNSMIKKDMPINSSTVEQSVMLRTLQDIEDQVFLMNAEDVVDIEINKTGVTFRLNNELLFDLGMATLKPGIQEILGHIGMLIQRFSCEVKVEGHTDDLPISTAQFPSNWNLSAARAVSVVRYFVETMALNPERFAAVGCGQYRPLVPNNTEMHRSQNRRVEIALSWESLESDLNY